MANFESGLKKLLRPKTIAVVGGAPAAMVIRQCRLMGFEGEIWPVHPDKKMVEDLTAYQAIDDLPAAPDATFIGVNRHITIGIVEALSRRGAGGAVCYASGFLEADEAGRGLQAELLAAAGEMPVLGPNCYGFVNYAEGALLWPDQHGGRRLAEGEKGVAIVTQSSNLSINITMQQRGLPIAYMLTAGNQALVGASDLAMAVLEDPRVTCLGMHIEGFDSISGMQQLAKRSRELKKPTVVLKVGKSQQARQATLTHTASMAGAHAASQAFLQRIGVGQVETLPALLESLKLLHVHGALSGYRLGSLSCSGGEASLIADAAKPKKIYFPALSEPSRQALQTTLGPLVTVNNPLDYHTYIWGDERGMTQVYQGMMAAGHDLTLLLMDFPHPDKCDAQDWEVALRAFEAAAEVSAKQYGVKAVLTSTLSENIPEQVVQRLMKKGIAAIGGIEEVLSAAEVAADIGAAWCEPIAESVMSVNQTMNVQQVIIQQNITQQTDNQPTIPQQTTAQKAITQQILNEAEAKAILSASGVSVPKSEVVTTLDEAQSAAEAIGYPIALKALGIAHKTESNAVRLNISDSQALASAFDELQQQSQSIYLEAMVQGTVAELIIGISKDSQFGLVMTLGAGGILVEILNDSVTLLLPASQQEIERSLLTLKTAPLLQGYRGRPVADVKATVETILNLQDYVLQQAHQLQELDINPLIVCAAGQGAYAADALIVLNQGEKHV